MSESNIFFHSFFDNFIYLDFNIGKVKNIYNLRYLLTVSLIFSSSDTSEEIKVSSEIKSFRLSSHSNRDDLIKLVDKLKPKCVIWVHGEKGGYDWLGNEILTRYPKTRVILPETGKEYQIDL
ncbi:MAG: hypothetical protein KKG06_01480 [Bacteroidetes bacterium]|nr:hypothetical protein [Bacteroidota bacterium]MBU1421850.1 hypothetical protein [Bacteroidota bacterium]